MRLTLNLTHGCNLACTYCFAGEARRAEMSPAVGRAAIDAAVRRRASSGDGFLDISFMGGEPLLALDLLTELADHARRSAAAAGLAVRFQVTTNGTLLDDARLERLARNDVDLAISIDGLADVHDRTRRTHGGARTGNAVWSALDRALARCRSVSVVCVVTPGTVDGLGDAVREFAARPIRRIALNPDWTAEWDLSDRERWMRAYEQVARVYLEAYRRGKPVALNLFDEKIDLRIRGAAEAKFGCGFDGDDLAVAPSGRVYGCGRAVGEDRDATASCGDVSQLADGFGVAHSQHESNARSECSSCAHQSRCASRCACANRESSGDANVPGEVICWHERMLIPIVDAVASTLFAEANAGFLLRFYGLEREGHDAAATSHAL